MVRVIMESGVMEAARELDEFAGCTETQPNQELRRCEMCGKHEGKYVERVHAELDGEVYVGAEAVVLEYVDGELLCQVCREAEGLEVSDEDEIDLFSFDPCHRN